ncbi:AAA domain-containing protein [Achromobacter deleyi]|uniref:AAA domain-containing protein n=1 Tax=Achromobacter deleyi TaxID=1353891 RepID=UPI0014924DC8|nr:AAA domain-containing protein [Achromobacter deleyi]QVQ29524.1 AAA family ATPase [Achromobacter deleyi]UIP19647.1 AAA domain-containing protein [Achromobacter deleyi]
MEIRLIEKAGVPASEIDALQRIQKVFDASKFTKEWRGYASFKLPRGGPGAGDDDFDLVLVTNTHIIVLELKNWRGNKLKARGGNWYVDGQPRGRSPVPLVNLKAKRLGTTLETRVGAAKRPWVLSFVVLTGSIKELDFSEEPGEAKSTLSLEALLAWSQEAKYRQCISQPSRINPLGFLTAYDLFFEGQKGRPAGFNIHGYRPEAQALWEHPKKLYAEFRAKETQDPDKLALLRQWDFGALGSELIGEGERGFIGLREQRVFEHVEPRNEELSRSLLRPIARMAEADVTRDFAELYALPPKVTRLSEFVNSGLPKLTSAERIVLVKAMLQRFADLHDLNVAHRDIGAHCLWVERPAKVVISGFPAAYYPTMTTMGAFRERVQVERSNLPEDANQLEAATPFRRDIYMLGVLAHLILHGERPARIDGHYVCESRASDAFDGALDTVLKKALSREPKDRFETAREMLEALNEASKGDNEQVIDLAAFDVYRAKSRVRDYPEEGEPLIDDDDLLAFRSTFEGEPVLVKEWHGVEPDLKHPDQAIRLLSFLERARNLRAAALPGVATVLDSGLSRRSLLVVQRWVEGETLTEWLTQPQERDARLRIARELTSTLAQMHEFEWPHGDIKPDNIIITPVGQPVYVDMLDFRRSSDDAYSTAYLPPDYKTLSPLGRDRYSLAAVLNELLIQGQEQGSLLGLERVQEEIQQLLTQRQVSALEPLQSALDGKGQSTELPDVEPYRVTIRGLWSTGVPPGELLGDNGYFYLSIENSRKNHGSRLIHLTGATAKMTVEWETAKRRSSWVTVKPIDLTQLIWAQEKCLGRIRARLVVSEGVRNDAADLEPSLELWDEQFSDEAAQDAEESLDSDTTTENIASSQGDDNEEQLALATGSKLDIDVKELWQALLSAEEESLPVATVTSEARRNPQRGHQILLPCALDGAGFDPDIDDRTWVERLNGEGQWRRCGDLELRDTSLGANAELAIERWNGKPAKVGEKLRLRTNMESASLTRRAAAVDRIIEGRSVVPDLLDFFQPGDTQPHPMEFHRPSEEALDAYTQGNKSLNESQKEAFRKALQFGPLSLLQGPPGTGKTWFIASLLHYLVTKEGARRILVVSQAHEAVNNALEKALELFEGKGEVFDAVRLGHESVVSDTIRHLHSSSIEQSYRESFKAEYKERVVRLGTEMGLPATFASAAVQLHVSVGRLINQISALVVDKPEPPSGTDHGDDQEPPSEDPAVQRGRQLMETLFDICSHDYQYDIGEKQLGEVLDDLYAQLADSHEIQSPQAIERLRRLLIMSDDWLKTLGEPAANFVEFLAKSRTIVAGTLVGIGRRAAGVIQNMYDWVVIDEAGRAAPSELAVAMQTGRRILLVGDHKQLPPTFEQDVRNTVSKKLGYATESRAFASDFERVFDSPYGLTVGATLKEQYRMAPTIGELVSEVFYGGQLATGRGASWLDTSLLPAPLRHEVCWVDTASLGRSASESTSPDKVDCWNDVEARVVMDVLRALLQNAALIRALKEGLQPGDPIVGIICMYSKQRAVLNRLKSESRWIPADLRRLVKIDTVDSYQGKENRIVILSTVRNNPQQNPGFLRSPNRINVAMSRAMERLVVVGATPMWKGKNENTPLGQVLKKIELLRGADRATIAKAQEFRA